MIEPNAFKSIAISIIGTVLFGVAEEEDDGVPFEEKMKNLSGELKEYFTEGEKLEKRILENLKQVKM